MDYNQELIASSLASLDQVHRAHRNQNTEDNFCGNEPHSNSLQKSSWNIDDFLAHYTPQHGTIQDFLLDFDEHITWADGSDPVLCMGFASSDAHFSPSACYDFTPRCHAQDPRRPHLLSTNLETGQH